MLDEVLLALDHELRLVDLERGDLRPSEAWIIQKMKFGYSPPTFTFPHAGFLALDDSETYADCRRRRVSDGHSPKRAAYASAKRPR